MHRVTVVVPSRFPPLLAAVVLGLLLCIAVFACAPAPVPSTPAVSPSTSPTIVGTSPVPQESGSVVGSSRGQTYHRSDCEWAMKIKPSNLVHFETMKEAEQARYRPCGSCAPK